MLVHSEPKAHEPLRRTNDGETRTKNDHRGLPVNICYVVHLAFVDVVAICRWFRSQLEGLSRIMDAGNMSREAWAQ